MTPVILKTILVITQARDEISQSFIPQKFVHKRYIHNSRSDSTNGTYIIVGLTLQTVHT